MPVEDARSKREGDSERYVATIRPAACRLCGSAELTLEYDQLAIADPSPRSPRLRSLWSCAECHAYWSQLPASISTDSYYRDKPRSDHDVFEAGRGDRFKRVRRAVEQGVGVPPYRLLDVGCASGAHFDAYGEDVDKFGIEPATSAAGGLEARGITYLGGALSDAAGERFDVVTSLDVLEHIEDPRPFLDGLDRCVAPGGLIVLVTGDIDSFSARWAGRRWLYYALPEHCSFYSSRALDRYWVGERGYTALTRTWIANEDVGFDYVRSFARGVVVEGVVKMLPARRARRLELDGRGRFPFFCDNMLLTYRKPAQAH